MDGKLDVLVIPSPGAKLLDILLFEILDKNLLVSFVCVTLCVKLET